MVYRKAVLAWLYDQPVPDSGQEVLMVQAKQGTNPRRMTIGLLLAVLILSAGCGRTVKNDEGQATDPPGKSEAVNPTPDPGYVTPGTADTDPKATENPGGESGVDGTIGEKPVPEPEAGLKPVPASTEALSVFPGVLRTMVMNKEEIVALLGDDYETYDNVSQAYSVYSWNTLNLVLEYDSISGKLRVLRVGDRTIFLDGASYSQADLNRDGILEGICAYEDLRDQFAMEGIGADPTNRREGHVVVMDEATGESLGESMTRPFGGFSMLSFLTAYGAEKECLILLDTQAEWECDVLAYANRQLVSMLPPEPLQMAEQAVVKMDAGTSDRVKLSVESVGLSFDCLMPQRLYEALEAGQTFKFRFGMNRKPVVTDDGLTLRLRNSLQVLLGNAADLTGTQIGRYIDLGQVTQEYRYVGLGKWTLLQTGGAPKYAAADQGGNVAIEDLRVGQAVLFASLYDFTDTFGLDPDAYADVDLIGGITFESDGMRISVINARIANIVLEGNCTLETARGLAVGDSRGEALEKYGHPDIGYFEDRSWTYWFYRDFGDGSERILSLDSFTFEFEGDRVARIALNAYIPID